MITCSDLHKSYKSFNVLKNINLLIKKGEITVVIGPSGSGKTTLLKCLSLLENPDKGIVSIDNEITANFPRDWDCIYTRQFPKTGIVFQNHFLWPHLTNAQNITLAFNHQLKKDQSKYYDDLMDLFGMSEFINKYPNESSTGQRQRVALVRTLIQRPDYLFLDEVTASLDIEQVGVLLNFLKNLRNEGVGVLLITHFLLFAQKVANQVVFLENGEIVESGTGMVLDNPNTTRLSEFVKSLNSIAII